MQNNPPGFIPTYGQGIYAKENQIGVEGGKAWLKMKKLHKYWPIFSHWSYSDLMSLTEENIDDKIRETGATGMTVGAKRKLVRCVSTLRCREDILKNLPRRVMTKECHITDALLYLENVIQTPLPTDYSEGLPSAIIYAVTKVYDYILKNNCTRWCYKRMDSLLKGIEESQILRFTAIKLHESMSLEDICFLNTSPAQEQQKSEEENPTPKSFRSRMLTNDSGFEDSFSGLDEWCSLSSNESDSIWPTNENTVMFVSWSRSLLEEKDSVEEEKEPQNILNITDLDSNLSAMNPKSVPKSSNFTIASNTHSNTTSQTLPNVLPMLNKSQEPIKPFQTSQMVTSEPLQGMQPFSSKLHQTFQPVSSKPHHQTFQPVHLKPVQTFQPIPSVPPRKFQQVPVKSRQVSWPISPSSLFPPSDSNEHSPLRNCNKNRHKSKDVSTKEHKKRFTQLNNLNDRAPSYKDLSRNMRRNVDFEEDSEVYANSRKAANTNFNLQNSPSRFKSNFYETFSLNYPLSPNVLSTNLLQGTPQRLGFCSLYPTSMNIQNECSTTEHGQIAYVNFHSPKDYLEQKQINNKNLQLLCDEKIFNLDKAHNVGTSRTQNKYDEFSYFSSDLSAYFPVSENKNNDAIHLVNRMLEFVIE